MGIIEPPIYVSSINSYQYFYGSGAYVKTDLSFMFSLNGNNYSTVGNGTIIYGGNANCYYCHTDYVVDRNYGGGAMNFTTIVPIESVPEPLAILGALTGVGFGVIFKRRIA